MIAGQKTVGWPRRGAMAMLSWIVLATTVAVVASTTTTVHGAANAVTPVRVLDTRTGLGGVNGKVGPRPIHLTLPAAAAGATSVVLNVTATDADGPGYVRVWPCSGAEPSTSSLNYTPGRTVANAAIVQSNAGGLCLSSLVPVHLAVDFSGWFTGNGDITGIAPHRLLDTRTTGDPLAAMVERRIEIAGTPGVPANASLVAINLTITDPAGPGWLVAAPCGQETSSSTMNFGAGETVANLTLAGLSGGAVCVRSLVNADLVVDTFGWSTGAGSVRVQSPARLLDTRDESTWPYGIAASNSTLTIQAAGRAGVPSDAAAAWVTVTAVGAAGDGFVSVWPCDQDWPTVSTANTWPGQAARANMALVKLAADGTICLKSFTGNGTPMHLVVDTFGWVTGGPARNVPPPTTPPPPPTTPPPPPTTPPPTGGHFGMLPVGAALPSDAQCAAAVRPAAEVRPDNQVANHVLSNGTGLSGRYGRVTGNFQGTTDELIQWASCKWGIDEDYVRAQAVIESYWHQNAEGDWGSTVANCAPGHGIGVDGRAGQCPESFGLLQVRYAYWKPGFPGALASTAFNLDYALAARRACFEGDETWLNTVERGRDYAAGDIWGCMGLWFSGRWYAGGADEYVARVQGALSERTWTLPGFPAG